jgi:hypothetical protein
MGMNDDHIARLESEIRYLKGLLDEKLKMAMGKSCITDLFSI